MLGNLQIIYCRSVHLYVYNHFLDLTKLCNRSKYKFAAKKAGPCTRE